MKEKPDYYTGACLAAFLAQSVMFLFLKYFDKTRWWKGGSWSNELALWLVLTVPGFVGYLLYLSWNKLNGSQAEDRTFTIAEIAGGVAAAIFGIVGIFFTSLIFGPL